jgi:hypothetical protein
VACAAWHTLAEQEHKRTKQKLRQREWEAECGFCSVGACRYGPLCQREKAVADDSGYEDEADGWSVVGRGRARSVQLKSQAETSGYGRFATLSVVGIEDMEERKAKCSGEVFFECDCDDPKFSFELRSDRRIRQQERRKQEGQQRKGRTARKRVKAAVEFKAAAVGNHKVHKRVCWLRAKMAVANNKWRCHIQERDAGSVAGDGYRDAPFGRVGMLQARENEKLEWRQAVQNTLSGQPVQQVESRWFRDRKHRNQHNGSNGSAAEISREGILE